MTEIALRYEEAAEPQPFLLWDSVWDQENFWADWVIPTTPAAGNAGGMQALHGINTAIVLCLFTNKRRETYQGAGLGPDPQGWWGDAVDVDATQFERPMGSLLYLLRRSVLTPEVAAQAVTYAQDALQVLIDQGLFASFDISSVPDYRNGRLDLIVNGYSASGQLIYGQQFSDLWRQEFPLSA